jgi:hypothetical protein
VTLLSWLAVPIALFGHRFAAEADRVPIAIFICAVLGGAAHLWGFLEGILILCGVHIRADARGIPLKD